LKLAVYCKSIYTTKENTGDIFKHPIREKKKHKTTPGQIEFEFLARGAARIKNGIFSIGARGLNFRARVPAEESHGLEIHNK
jgi:hypothetical protein